MDYLQFSQEYIDEYELNGSLLSHSRISPTNRARLLSWISQECYKQKFSRFSYHLTCSYIDLYFMKKNQINLKDYQILALGALVLASKQVQTQGKIPMIDLRLFPLEQILKMEKNIAFGLNFYLNPPNYIQKMNNIAKIWDIKCQMGQIQSPIRYFKENKQSYLRLKTLYEKMDCLTLFKKILDFDMNDVILTFFYCQTRAFHASITAPKQKGRAEILLWQQNEQLKDEFQLMFEKFLDISQIQKRPNISLIKIAAMLTKQAYPINDQLVSIPVRTYTQLISYQTHNSQSYKFYEKNKEAIQRI